ncbi:MAG: hypothetical protein ACP5P1_14355 [Acidimicrobiales bacterium]
MLKSDLDELDVGDHAKSDTGGAGFAETSKLKGFSPGWFGAVMGTAIVAIAASQNPGGVTALASADRTLSQVMAIAATAIAVPLLVGYIARFAKHAGASLADLNDPTVGALYGTIPGGILVLAATASAVGPTWFSAETVRDLVVSLVWLGAPLAFVGSVVFAYTLFVGPYLRQDKVNGSWFIPPVVTIVMPLVLVPLVHGSSPATARGLMLIAYAFWGMGFMLYLLILGMLHTRLVLHPLPHAALAPSLWIGLGPIGVGALALIKMSAAASAVFGPSASAIAATSQVAAAALWGFGVWWLAIAATLLVRYLRAGRLPFGIGWWGFTFPIGAYTVATLALGSAWHMRTLDWAAGVLFVTLIGFWVVVAARTAWALSTGEAWRVATPALGDEPGSPD